MTADPTRCVEHSGRRSARLRLSGPPCGPPPGQAPHRVAGEWLRRDRRVERSSGRYVARMERCKATAAAPWLQLPLQDRDRDPIRAVTGDVHHGSGVVGLSFATQVSRSNRHDEHLEPKTLPLDRIADAVQCYHTFVSRR